MGKPTPDAQYPLDPGLDSIPGNSSRPLAVGSGREELPPYSPKLTLIERLWKFLRQKVVNTCFYRTKGQFRPAVLGFFDRLNEFGHDLAALLTLTVHLFELQTTL